ncbi:MAG: hypothetical protein H0W89_05240 [Candidatus Levybacteria bacterium]|nr:hypothetical protein [Candidatus Levybacteria bacterium]
MKSPESSNQFADVRERFHDNRITVVYNANAGIFKKDPIQALWFKHKLNVMNTLLSGSDFFDFDVNMTPTTSIAHANDVVDAAIDAGHGAIIPIGGDSTVGRVAHRIALAKETKADPKPRLIIVGGGTQNVLKSEITNQKDIVKATVDLFVNGKEVYVDLGVVRANNKDVPFAINAGIGMDAIMLDTWEQGGKGSRVDIFWHFLKDRHNIKPVDLHVFDTLEEIDQIFESVSAMPIVNGGKYGIFPITNSNMTDGRVESVVLPSHLKEGEHLMHLLTTSLRANKSFEGAHYMGLQNATIKDINGDEVIFQCDGDPHRAGSDEINVFTMRRAVPMMTTNADSSTLANVA